MQLLRRKNSGGSATADAAQKHVEQSFDAAGVGASLKIMSRDDRGRLQYLTTIPASDVNPKNVEEVVKDMYGGGRFLLLPVSDDGRKSGDGFEIDIAGVESKIKKPRKIQTEGTKRTTTGMDELRNELGEAKKQIADMQQREGEDRIIASLRSEIDELKRSIQDSRRPDILGAVLGNLDKLMMGFSSLNSKESMSDMMQAMSETVKNLKETAGPDETERLAKLAELYNSMVQASRPPVSIGGAGMGGGWKSGAGEFLGSLAGGFDRESGGKLSQVLTSLGGGGTPQLGPGAQLPGRMPGPAGFSGVPSTGTAEGSKQGQHAGKDIAGGMGNLSLFSLGFDPILMVRKMLASREDARQVAGVVLQTAEFVSGFIAEGSPLDAYLRRFYDDPGGSFDAVVGYVEELRGASEQYVSELRESIMTEVDNLMRQQRWYQAHGGFPWEQDTEPAGEKQPEPEAEEGPLPAPPEAAEAQEAETEEEEAQRRV